MEGMLLIFLHLKKRLKPLGIIVKPDVLVLVETTVPPGTSEKIVKPLLKECLEKRNLPVDELKVGHSYERVMPGPKYIDSIQNFYRVFAGVDEKSADATEQFLRSVIRTDEYPIDEIGQYQMPVKWPRSWKILSGL